MSSADYNIDGLIRVSQNIKEAVNVGILAAGEHVRRLASELAPVDTGDLAASGEVHLVSQGTVEVSFGNNLEDARAVVQEFGSVFMPAQPYLGPALRAIDIGLEVSKAIKRLV